MEQSYSSIILQCLRYGDRWRISQKYSSVLDGLASPLESNLSYGTINFHRSVFVYTLLPIDEIDVDKHSLVTRLLRSVYNSGIPVTMLGLSWFVTMLKLWSSNVKLILKCPKYKTTMSIALDTARRCSSLYLLTLK